MMDVIVAGGGDVGQHVARSLLRQSHYVTIVDSDPARAASLRTAGFDVVTGNASVATALEAAGAPHADLLLACTERGEENLVISVVAKQHLHIPRVVARINDDETRWLFGESWSVDAALSSAEALTAPISSTTMPSTGTADAPTPP